MRLILLAALAASMAAGTALGQSNEFEAYAVAPFGGLRQPTRTLSFEIAPFFDYFPLTEPPTFEPFRLTAEVRADYEAGIYRSPQALQWLNTTITGVVAIDQAEHLVSFDVTNTDTHGLDHYDLTFRMQPLSAFAGHVGIMVDIAVDPGPPGMYCEYCVEGPPSTWTVGPIASARNDFSGVWFQNSVESVSLMRGMRWDRWTLSGIEPIAIDIGSTAGGIQLRETDLMWDGLMTLSGIDQIVLVSEATLERPRRVRRLALRGISTPEPSAALLVLIGLAAAAGCRWLRSSILAIAVLVSASQAVEAVTVDGLPEWRKAQQEDLSEKLADAKAELAAAKSGRVVRAVPKVLRTKSSSGRLRMTFPTLGQKKDAIETAQRRHDFLESEIDDASSTFPPLEKKLGSVGVFPDTHRSHPPTGKSTGILIEEFRAARVLQVVDERNALIETVIYSRRDGSSTRDVEHDDLWWAQTRYPHGWAEDEGIGNDKAVPFLVIGKREYTDGLGRTRSVFLLEDYKEKTPEDKTKDR